MGLGHERQRTRSWISETLRLGDSSKRTHSPGAPESGRQRDFPHCDVDCFPAARTGNGANPGPLKVPAEKLRSMLGLTSVQYKQGKSALAVVDSNLS